MIPSHDPSRISRLRPIWRKLPSLRGKSPRVRGFADFYQRFFGETPSQKNPRYLSRINQGSQTRKTPTSGGPPPTKSVIYAALGLSPPGGPPGGTPSISLIPPKALVVVCGQNHFALGQRQLEAARSAWAAGVSQSWPSPEAIGVSDRRACPAIGPEWGSVLSIDDPRGVRIPVIYGTARPCLLLTRAPDRGWPRRPGIGDHFTPPRAEHRDCGPFDENISGARSYFPTSKIRTFAAESVSRLLRKTPDTWALGTLGAGLTFRHPPLSPRSSMGAKPTPPLNFRPPLPPLNPIPPVRMNLHDRPPDDFRDLRDDGVAESSEGRQGTLKVKSQEPRLLQFSPRLAPATP